MLWFKALLSPFKRRAWNGLRLELWGAVGRKQCFVLQGVQAPTTLNCFIHPQHRQSWPLLESKSIESKSRDLIYIHTKRSNLLVPFQYAFAELNPIKFLFVKTYLWRLVDATHDKWEKEHSRSTGSGLHPLARMFYLDISWGKDGERGGWVLTLFGKCFPL